MGFLAPAVPWIVKGAGALGGILAGKKATSSAQARSPEEQAALQGATGSAGTLTQTGTNLMGKGLDTLTPAASYYQTLLGGNRAAMAQATAAPRAALTDTYQGATRSLEHSGLQGAGRDLATAELNRDRASRIAGLTTGVQPGAAAALADMGTNLTGQGGNLLQGAGGIWQNLLGQGMANRMYARGEGEKAGGPIGTMLFDLLSGSFGKGGVKLPKATVGLPNFSGTTGFPGLPGRASGPF